MVDAAAAMTDFRRVRVSLRYRRVQPRDLLAEHRASVAWLPHQLAEPDAPPTLIVSHHAPSARSLPAAYRDDDLAPAYAGDLEALMGAPVVARMHGHVHTPADYDMNATRLLCNPRGYCPNELTAGFDAGLTVTLDPRSAGALGGHCTPCGQRREREWVSMVPPISTGWQLASGFAFALPDGDDRCAAFPEIEHGEADVRK